MSDDHTVSSSNVFEDLGLPDAEGQEDWSQGYQCS